MVELLIIGLIVVTTEIFPPLARSRISSPRDEITRARFPDTFVGNA